MAGNDNAFTLGRMRYPLFLILGLVFVSGPAQSSDLTDALAALRGPVTWDVDKARRADVTCDGKPDIIMFGSDGYVVWVGVVPGGGNPQIMEFSASKYRLDGFRSPPVRINIHPIHCEIEEGHLDGCRPVRNCKGFSVDDDSADTFNFYWDSRLKLIRWWRN